MKRSGSAPLVIAEARTVAVVLADIAAAVVVLVVDALVVVVELLADLFERCLTEIDLRIHNLVEH